MAKTTLTASVTKSLGKRGKTAADIALKLGANQRTISTILAALVREGKAQIAGTKQTSGTGRPSNLYALNA